MPGPVLNLVVLKTSRLQLCRIFYEQLGLLFVEEQHGRGPVHFSCDAGGTILEIYPGSTDTMSDALRLGFAVADPVEVLSRLQPEAVVSAVRMTKTGLVGLVIDPDGRKIEIRKSDFEAPGAAAIS